MTAVTGDLIRITDQQTLLGQQVLNVYFYRVNETTTLTGDYLAVIGGWFVPNVVTPVAAMQEVHLSHNSLFLENLSNGVDIESYTTGLPILGAATGDDCMPPFVSYGYQLLREERNTRNGYKRFAAVPESLVTDGVYIGSMTPIHTIEAALGADIVLGIIHALAPVIVKHPVSVPAGAYIFSNISAGIFKGIGSQNTRKFGRGA